MPFPISFEYQIPELFGSEKQSISLYGGITTLIGPNGSGKTQVLRALRNSIQKYFSHKSIDRKILYLSSGRLIQLEYYRSNYDGNHSNLNYDDARFGDKHMQARRYSSEAASGIFHILHTRPDLKIKVTERLKTFFKRDFSIEWDAGQLRVSFSRTDLSDKGYSAAREASGLLHLVLNLTVIFDDQIGAILVDEPEVSFHPQLQAFLLREFKKVAGTPEDAFKKLIIIATHSTEFIDIKYPQDLTRIVFFQDASTKPLQIDPEAGELKHQKLTELLSNLGYHHKAAFFCSKPLLVEGLSDEIICKSLDNHLNLNIDVAGSQILPISGKGQIPVIAKLMKLLKKKPILLIDLDAFVDDIYWLNLYSDDIEARKISLEKGFSSFFDAINSAHNDAIQFIDKNYKDIFDEIEKHSIWINRNKEEENIALRRAAFAILMSSTNKSISSWINPEQWLGIHTRLSAIFDLMEEVGCFILRRGTIENYYKDVEYSKSYKKPSVAMEESNNICGMELPEIENQYSDIIRALRYAAQLPKIDELSTLSDLFLAVVAPALNRLNKDTTDKELQSSSYSILNERSSLFNLTKVNTDGDDLAIKVELQSKILDVKGFPIKLQKDCDILKEAKKLS